jgi:2-oxoglutarate dehydrogenase E2 component (dihydrolipoamide succinyltransferase)
MALIYSILVPQESVNDEFLSLNSLYVKSGDFIEDDVLLAELETSKALLEIRSENRGYVKVLVEEKADVKIGTLMFEFYDQPFEESIDTLPNSEFSNLISNDLPNPNKDTKFSKLALKFIKDNGLDIKQYSSFNFVTSKDLIPLEVSDSSLFKTKIEFSKNTKVEVDVELKSISKSKKVEFEYLYSVNSSSVISRLSTKINVKYITSIGEVQNFISSTPLPTIIHEVSRLLIKYPNLNSFFDSGKQAFYKCINVGFAIDDNTNGLKVASILNSDKLSLLEVENSILDLTLKYSNNQLNVSDLTFSTFTITDLFNTKIYSFHPLVNVNNSSILGISGYVDGGFIIDISFDHRLTSGKEVSLFLNDLKLRLEARFDSLHPKINDNSNNAISCVKCLRGINEDLGGNLFFQKIISSKFEGYICSNCSSGW